MANQLFLKKKSGGPIHQYTDELAKRDDMVTCDKNGKECDDPKHRHAPPNVKVMATTPYPNQRPPVEEPKQEAPTGPGTPNAAQPTPPEA